MRCMIPSCKNSRRNRYAGLSFHRFPENELYRAMWARALNIKDLDMFKSPRICSEHFVDQHFIKTSRGPRLNVNAVPIISEDEMKSFDNPIITNSTADAASSTDSTAVATDTGIVKTEVDFSEYTVYEPKIVPTQISECANSYFGKIEPDFGKSLQDCGRLLPTSRVSAATNTSPDLTNDYVSRLEAKIRSQQAIINDKINEINNLKRQLRRRQRKPKTVPDLMKPLREKHIISESTRRKLNKNW